MSDAEHFNKDDIAYCTQLVRDNARDLYLADLLLPEIARSKAIVLHAFHVEVTNITLGKGDPLAREVRLQWWAEVTSKVREEEAEGHPVARAILILMANEPLVQAALSAKIDAHVFDLYQDPMPDRTTLEGWCGETRSSLYQLVAQFCGAEAKSDLADASGHAGCCMGIIGILENMHFLREHAQNYIPKDILLSAGLTPEEFLTAPDERHAFAISAFVALAREHQLTAQKSLVGIEPTARLAFKTFSLANLYLKRIENKPLSVLQPRQPISALRIQWNLLRGA